MTTLKHTSQTRIPCVMMRGGTSKGAYFFAHDLPADTATRDAVLLAVMGSPDRRQIDGIGGANSLTSKVAIISRSQRPDADVDYLFAQVVVDEARVDYGQNCGNILAGVGPFAIEQGLVPVQGDKTAVAIHMVNTGQIAIEHIATPDGCVRYEGDARIDGVPGTAAPIPVQFVDTAGSSCGALLPTGNASDIVDGVEVTCIDNGMPLVLMRARDVDVRGDETPEQLNANTALKARIEAIRLQLGPRMNLGDVSKRTVPKMCLVAPPMQGGALVTRTFIPHVCHTSIGVLAAVSVATAAVLPGSVCDGIARVPDGMQPLLSIEHPTGEFSVELTLDLVPQQSQQLQESPRSPQQPAVRSAALLRTARWLFDGFVSVPKSVWDGVSGKP